MNRRVVMLGRRWPFLSSRGLALAAAALALAACTSPLLQEGLRDDRDLKAVLEAYRRQAAAPAGDGIRRLEVTKATPSAEATVSLDVDRAPLATVVLRVLTEAGAAYVVDPPLPRATVTARLEAAPLLRALNTLLEPQGLAATVRDGVVTIGDGVEAPAEGAAAAAPATRVMTAQVPLTHLDKDTVTALLQGLLQKDPSSDDAGLRFSAQPYTNTVFLVGSPVHVRRAVRLLRQADQDPAHVVIEALVVEIDINALEDFGSSLTDFRNEQFSALTTAIGSPAGPALKFLYQELQPADQQGRGRKFNAAIHLLVQQGKARVIARPHLAAISGRKARIEISQDRYILVQSASQGATLTTSQPVQGGVILDITPHVTRGGQVRMGLVVEQSTFISENVENVTTTLDKNKAETTMEVASGQAILIGGLRQHLRTTTNAGLPWLRHIPILNLVFAKFGGEERRQEVLVYITPYIWRPGLDTPIPEPDRFGPQQPRDNVSPIERFER